MGKPEGKRPLERPGRRGKDNKNNNNNNKTCLKEIGRESVD
jgi:hypothetical protein